MGEHFKSLSAVFPIISKNNEGATLILLHRRKNTGYQDGKWDVAGSGHVDEGETAKEAVVRECREELGIETSIDHISFAHLSHRLASDKTYYDIYFTVDHYDGTPSIMEPKKCAELEWFDIKNLPPDIIDCRRSVINDFQKNIAYSELLEL